jgi:hypothetical protein
MTFAPWLCSATAANGWMMPQTIVAPSADWKSHNHVMGSEAMSMGAPPSLTAPTLTDWKAQQGNVQGRLSPTMLPDMLTMAPHNVVRMGMGAGNPAGFGHHPMSSPSMMSQNQMMMHLIHHRMLQQQQIADNFTACIMPKDYALMMRNDAMEPSTYRHGTFMESDLINIPASEDSSNSEDGLPEILRHVSLSPSHTDRSHNSTIPQSNSAPISEASFSSITVSTRRSLLRSFFLGEYSRWAFHTERSILLFCQKPTFPSFVLKPQAIAFLSS